MKVLRYSTQIHKWIGLVVGIQMLFWVAGGVVMTAIPIETVRSEHRLKASEPQTLPVAQIMPLAEVASITGLQPSRAELKSTPRGAAWVLTPLEGEAATVDASTGRPFAPLTATEVTALASASYQGTAAPNAPELLQQAPKETGRSGPIWRVNFNDTERTTFYLSPQTGDVVSKRSAVWRFYDFFWRLHILDFKNGDNFNHPLLVGLTVLTLSIVITGFILLWIRLSRDLKMAKVKRTARQNPRG